jgi:hypothetical protein
VVGDRQVHPFRLRLGEVGGVRAYNGIRALLPGESVAAAEKGNLLQASASGKFEQSSYFLY